MVPVDLKSLIGKLNNHCRQALEGAVGLTLSRTQYNVEIEHWLLKLLESPTTDLVMILHHYEVNIDQLQRDLTVSVDRFKMYPPLTLIVLCWSPICSIMLTTPARGTRMF